ncbi:MAG: CoA transferase [Gammaproteobacteria bacterium]|nr:CoA transferase [Gammaproteobacteria bacterium]
MSAAAGPGQEGALQGIRVVELGQGVSAPFCARLYGDYGAEVIKVEPPGGGDVARRWGPFPADVPHPEKSGLYFVLNSDKRGVTLDVGSAAGRELFLRLLATADVLIENNPPARMREWGLDYATLGPLFPRLVMISITPFGQTGPYADWHAADLNAFHLTGAGSRYCGRPGEPPLQHGTFSTDYFGAYVAATWGLAALFGRDVAGGGQQLDVATAETVAALFVGAQNIGGFAQDGRYDKRSGVGMALASPATILPCKDGYVWMLALETGQWRGLVAAMGNPEWAQAEMFDDMFVRGENADFIYAMMREWTITLTKQEIMDLVQAYGVPSTAVYTAADVASLPHLRERGFLRELEHPLLGRLPGLGAPVRLTDGAGGARRAAPLLGQHNDAVLRVGLGLSAAELAAHAAAGVV